MRPVSPLIDRPIRELKGFERVSLKLGETKQVTIPIAPDAFSHWDVTTHGWKADPGDYAIDIGDSSRNILSSGHIELK